MSPDVPPSKMAIGATLRDARRRYGLEVREVEERTKIRARYIRALENEDWETLPAPAYVRGFLRTYGQMLGLDGEMLADEFRRRYGDEPSGSPSASEPVLSERRRPGERPPSRGRLIIGIIAGIVVLLLVLSILGGDDGGDKTTPQDGKQAKQDGGKGKAKKKKDKKGSSEPKREPVKAVIVARTGVEVCLVGGGDEPLLDGQQLLEGARESYDGFKKYRLDLGPGSVKFVVGKDSEDLAVSEPTSFEADSNGITQIEYRGPDCP